MNLIGKRYFFFLFSALIIIPGLIIIAVWGLPFSVDFKGGSLLEAKFASGTLPDPARVIEVYTQMGVGNVQVSTSGKDVLVIRSAVMDDTARAKVLDLLSKTFNDTVTAQRFDTVGPSVSQEVTSRAGVALAAAALALVVYISFAFRSVAHAFRYAIATILALIHDVLVILSLVAIGSRLFSWQIDTLFLTALLTVIAFSAQDTIVVFDRLRENSAALRKMNYETLVNHSVVQTLTRSINTQLMTVDFMLLAMALFGGSTLKEFAIVLLIGMLSGSYSSDFIAAPILVVWENQEWKTWFKRNQRPAQANL